MRMFSRRIVTAAFAGIAAMLAPGGQSVAAEGGGGVVLQASPEGGLLLCAGAVQVRLARPDGTPARRADLQARGPLYLVVSNLSARAPPGAIFRLYLGLRPGETPRPDDARYVGSLSFYDAVRSPTGGLTAQSVSLEVTHVIARDRRGPVLEPTVTIVPSGPLRPGSEPRVGGLMIATG